MLPLADHDEASSYEQEVTPARRRIAMFASVDSFEGFYGGTFGLDRETYVTTYRNDFLWEYAEGLRRLGHKIFLYIRSYGPPELTKAAEGISVRFLHLPSWLRGTDALLFRMRHLPHVPAMRERLSYLGYGSGLQRALQEDQIDVLYHQEVWTSRLDLLLSRVSLPVVGADHGAPYAEWMRHSKARLLRRAASVICQSQVGVARAHEFGARAELMYNGVDTEFFRPDTSGAAREPYIMAVGRLVEQQKRFSDLLVAMQSLPEYKLVLVGSGPDEAKLKDLAKTLGIEDRVHFAGFVSDREHLRTLYQHCSAFVSTSSWEALALVMLEAMSCAAPVVATEIPSFMDMLTDGKDGLLVPVGATDRLVLTIRRACKEGVTLGQHARETVLARFSARALYSELSAILQAV